MQLRPHRRGRLHVVEGKHVHRVGERGAWRLGPPQRRTARKPIARSRGVVFGAPPAHQAAVRYDALCRPRLALLDVLDPYTDALHDPHRPRAAWKLARGGGGVPGGFARNRGAREVIKQHAGIGHRTFIRRSCAAGTARPRAAACVPAPRARAFTASRARVAGGACMGWSWRSRGGRRTHGFHRRCPGGWVAGPGAVGGPRHAQGWAFACQSDATAATACVPYACAD
jgi:hypothetical protein